MAARGLEIVDLCANHFRAFGARPRLPRSSNGVQRRRRKNAQPSSSTTPESHSRGLHRLRGIIQQPCRKERRAILTNGSPRPPFGSRRRPPTTRAGGSRRSFTTCYPIGCRHARFAPASGFPKQREEDERPMPRSLSTPNRARRFVLALIAMAAIGAILVRTAIPPLWVPAVHRAVTGTMNVRKIPGLSLAVLTRGKVRWSSGYGLADVENHVPAGAPIPSTTGPPFAPSSRRPRFSSRSTASSTSTLQSRLTCPNFLSDPCPAPPANCSRPGACQSPWRGGRGGGGSAFARLSPSHLPTRRDDFGALRRPRGDHLPPRARLLPYARRETSKRDAA